MAIVTMFYNLAIACGFIATAIALWVGISALWKTWQKSASELRSKLEHRFDGYRALTIASVLLTITSYLASQVYQSSFFVSVMLVMFLVTLFMYFKVIRATSALRAQRALDSKR